MTLLQSHFLTAVLTQFRTCAKKDFFHMDPLVVDFAGILKLIHSLKLSSSCGADEINSKFLRNTAVYSFVFFMYLFTQSIEYSTLPADLKVGKVVPLLKSGNPHSPLNADPFHLPAYLAKSLNKSYFLISFHFLSQTLSSLRFSMGFARTTPAKHKYIVYT
uniref:Tick transposon n=1 Tax=Rhipicephalus microplus TaxID=6941 RepID=A0A6G5A957_RHIMP